MGPFRHILVPVDLSARSRHTAIHADDIARSCGAHLSLVHVLPFFPTEAGPDLSYRERSTVLLALSDFAEELRAHRPVPFVLLDGDPAPEIVGHAASHGVDLIVVGCHHRGALERLFAGSVAERVCADAPCSVWTVPDPAEEARRPPPEPAEVVCAVDLTDSSVHTVQAALRLVRASKARLTLVHVVEPSHSRERTAYDRIADLIRDHPDVDTRVVLGRAPEAIASTVASRRAGLLIVGAHETRVLGRKHLGRTAQSLVRDAACPILLVRPTATPVRAPSPRATASWQDTA